MSEKNRYKGNKKWLISKLKTSGSKKRYAYSPDYAAQRKGRKPKEDALPKFESFYKERAGRAYQRLNTQLLRRFLHSQVGNDWDEVYAAIIERIPTKLMEYKEAVYWFVAAHVKWEDGTLWNLDNQRPIRTDREDQGLFSAGKFYDFFDFYVDPDTNFLVRNADSKTTRVTKNMDALELRKFRECEQHQRLERREEKNQAANDPIFEDELKRRKSGGLPDQLL